ncbi:adenosylcobinamide-GDP ribazoletransferase [Prochlorococcus sp. MIT 1300]|uniref:adenosylcobinamide-GDP ribazoletransferase n=1 Tax=Prochlorococcus sp. MIT 1300 TaxID=3096218 RepID=UPI002A76679D|nr:adenosylcobinamide-GDP ribazoletransferase [Prochlorococcus sp. MIT 1300]
MRIYTPRWIQDLAGAWIFYSILPPWPCPKPRFERIARFAPLIGIILGLLQSSLWQILNSLSWDITAKAMAVFSLGIFLTGGLHVDGLMDTADGIAAGEKRCLEAMKDSRIGATGIQTLLLITLLQLSALIELDSMAIYAIPIACFWSRCAPIYAIANFPYLREKSYSSFHSYYCRGFQDSIPAILLSIALFTIILCIKSEIALKLSIGFGLGIIPCLLIPTLLGKKLNGHTGDSYGASTVLVETSILLLLAFLI